MRLFAAEETRHYSFSEENFNLLKSKQLGQVTDKEHIRLDEIFNQKGTYIILPMVDNCNFGYSKYYEELRADYSLEYDNKETIRFITLNKLSAGEEFTYQYNPNLSLQSAALHYGFTMNHININFDTVDYTFPQKNTTKRQLERLLELGVELKEGMLLATIYIKQNSLSRDLRNIVRILTSSDKINEKELVKMTEYETKAPFVISSVHNLSYLSALSRLQSNKLNDV